MNTKPSKPIPLGNITYVSHSDRATFRPSVGMSLMVLLLGGGFGLLTGSKAVMGLLWALNVIFGWKFPGPLTNLGLSAPINPPGFFVIAMLGMSLFTGAIAFAMIGAVVQLLRFWYCQPTFDYSTGVFRRGGQTVCHFSEIGAIHLRRITDPNYPGKAKLGLALTLRDGSRHTLEWQFRRRFGIGAAKIPYTDLGELRGDQRQEAARAAAAEVAARIGVPLDISEERGNFAPQKGM